MRGCWCHYYGRRCGCLRFPACGRSWRAPSATLRTILAQLVREGVFVGGSRGSCTRCSCQNGDTSHLPLRQENIMTVIVELELRRIVSDGGYPPYPPRNVLAHFCRYRAAGSKVITGAKVIRRLQPSLQLRSSFSTPKDHAARVRIEHGVHSSP